MSSEENITEDLVDIDDEIQDWRGLLGITSSVIPKRGEKDYEPDGTLIQRDILTESRNAMYTALEGVRGHSVKQALTAIYYPESKKALIASPKGPFFKTMGFADSKSQIWLNQEELLYLCERGSLIVELPSGLALSLESLYSYLITDEDDLDKYQVYAYLKRHGYLVMRNQEGAVYAGDPPTAILKDDISLPHWLTWAYFPLRIIRSFKLIWLHRGKQFGLHSGILNRLKDRIVSTFRRIGVFSFPPFHNLHFKRKKYFNYLSIFKSLRIIPSYNKDDCTKNEKIESPYKIFYNIWKPVPNFRKTTPSIPDWQVVIINTNKVAFPSLLEIQNLFNHSSTKIDTPKQKTNPRYKPKNDSKFKQNDHIKKRNEEFKKRDQRLKNGYRNILIAIVNQGVMNFVKLGEADFSCEEIWTDPIKL